MNKSGFLKAIETLKLYRRAELTDDDGQRLVKELYVDPLPDEHILQTILRPNTTFLIGRKGSGKSTIFQRAQDALDEDARATWAYVDIKTLFESCAAEMAVVSVPGLDGALPADALRRLYTFKTFVLQLVKEIKRQINQRVSSTVWSRFRERITGTTSELFERLDEFLQDLERDTYINATSGFSTAIQAERAQKDSHNDSAEASVKAAAAPSAEAKLLTTIISEIAQRRSENYSQVFIRIFNIKLLIDRLRDILSTLGLKHLYIFVDDFSELPKVEMEEVVDTILAPFNNWSDEFIKLKVAVYPGRMYLGSIDRSKIDEVYLDIYRAYGRNDVAGMEDKAIDFTRRLLLKRFEYFCDGDITSYFEVGSSSDIWQLLFYSSLGNPRILGYILYFCYETNIVYDKKISARTIRDASRRYYEEKISYYFKLNKFLHESFEERSSIFSLKELLDEIVKRAKGLRTYSNSKVMQELLRSTHGRPPTSHFHVVSGYDPILSTLELNFFITKYYEMKDRDGREVSVYAINLGLCELQSIAFGRPTGKREFRLYFVERIFDYSPIVSSYLKVNQEITCDACSVKHPPELLPTLEAYEMLCPACKRGTCRVVNISRKYEGLIRSVAADALLPSTELGILKTLHDERRSMFAKEIAAELDCSYQLIGRRGKALSDRKLVSRDENEAGRRTFKLDDSATSMYFSAEEVVDTFDDVIVNDSVEPHLPAD